MIVTTAHTTDKNLGYINNSCCLILNLAGKEAGMFCGPSCALLTLGLSSHRPTGRAHERPHTSPRYLGIWVKNHKLIGHLTSARAHSQDYSPFRRREPLALIFISTLHKPPLIPFQLLLWYLVHLSWCRMNRWTAEGRDMMTEERYIRVTWFEWECRESYIIYFMLLLIIREVTALSLLLDFMFFPR